MRPQRDSAHPHRGGHDHDPTHDHGHAHDQGHAHDHEHHGDPEDHHHQGHDQPSHGTHSHAGHSHAHGAGADEWRVAGAFLIVVVFLAIQVAGGLISGSLALLADAGHMVSDAAALGMSWAALRIGRRPADPRRSYGYRRLEVLVAFANGCALLVVTLWIVCEAVVRLVAPHPVLGRPMLAVAIAGLLANALAFAILSGGRRDNLNLRSAWLHVLGDLLGFAITVVAAAVIVLTGWSRIDPLLSMAVAVLILRSAVQIVRSSGHILLEGAPVGVDAAAVRDDLLGALPSVCDVHHVHAWSLTEEEQFITLHVRATADADVIRLVPAICQRLEQRFGITHATIQVDHDVCDDEHHG
ncbi:MAG TPA: cation diffusion facilitator family transporter [Steroidobacteraceae bacterium]|nr:cation diffusion facilitator family transporter [Steroidobacteraceae bacterium]